MAIINKTITGGSAQSKTSGTSIVCTPTTFSPVAGDVVFAVISTDDGGSGYGVSHAGTAAVSWSNRKDQISSTHSRVIVFRGSVTAGGTITSVTASWTTSVLSKTLCLAWFSGIGTEKTVLGNNGNIGNFNVGMPSAAAWNTGDVVIGGFAGEDNGVAAGAGMATMTGESTEGIVASSNGTTGGSSTTNIEGFVAYKLFTSTQSSGSAGTLKSTNSTNAAGVWVFYAPAVEPARRHLQSNQVAIMRPALR